jgi:hypothetical protein
MNSNVMISRHERTHLLGVRKHNSVKLQVCRMTCTLLDSV